MLQSTAAAMAPRSSFMLMPAGTLSTRLTVGLAVLQNVIWSRWYGAGAVVGGFAAVMVAVGVRCEGGRILVVRSIPEIVGEECECLNRSKLRKRL